MPTQPTNTPHTEAADPLAPQQPLISAGWLLSALGIVLAAAAVCAYFTFCLLFYQGSWQLIFHPSHTITATPGVPYQEIQFDYTETGKPQLTGWWIPAGPGARDAGKAILYLHDGRGSLSDTVGQLDLLHTLGINIFAFDYRGFGKSAKMHPSETSMDQDANAALAYLIGTRHLPAHSVILYGSGLGASVAVTMATRHPETAALVLENVGPTALTVFAADGRARFLPVRLLTSDRFDPIKALKTLQTPKLLIERDNNSYSHSLFNMAAMPKRFFQIPHENQAQYLQILQSFLDEPASHP